MNNRLFVSSKIIERMISQNAFDDIIYDFKYYEDVSDDFKEKGGTLLPLWKILNRLDRFLGVTSICWNSKYFDLVAVTYGSNDFFDDSKGYVMLYSLKNPESYEFKIETNSGVMSIDFHDDYPYLIAVGLYDGNVCVYDLSDHANFTKSIYSSSVKTFKHSDPVWQVKWERDDTDGYKNFISISSDGRMVQWTLKKNGLHAYVMLDFEVVMQKEKQEKNQIIENHSSSYGTCFDLNVRPDDLFIVGTEDGKVYEFSKNYKNQLLTTFDAHLMPIYKIKWNYFHKKVFITCSSDNTVKIWDHRYQDPIFKYVFATSITDIDWAPFSSTIFGLVTTDGFVYLYDISVDKSEPICVQSVYQKKKRKLTHLAFNPYYPIIIISDERGHVLTFKLSHNLRASPNDTKNVSITIINKYNFEVGKLDTLINSERDSNCEVVKTSRKYFDFIEKVAKVKGSLEKEEEEEEERKKAEKAKKNKSSRLMNLAINMMKKP